MKINKTFSAVMAALVACACLAAPAPAEFRLVDVKPRVLTPGGSSGFNDRVIFSFVEPDEKLTLRIFTLDGRKIEEIDYGAAGTERLVWNACAAGSMVSPGVYIYQLEADGKVFSGTLVVAR
ncbi:MAG: hypothetical protein CVU77_01505 [Elusimicrobia bacterium HGW-Elusimicrobia-1]|jgi:hypothetical protein|nr:MAG: hypothetical protein CVU77_01505 [Elusimicrobia bacterium HGW-Elusimicrobia-1]